jgi:aminopeptidase
MDFNQKLKNYADLIVKHGANVQPGQKVNISAEVYHRELVNMLSEVCYDVGASYVNIDLIEPRLGRTRILKSKDDDLSYVPKFVGPKYQEFIDDVSANIRIIGPEYPEIFSDLDPKKINKTRIAQFQAIKHYYQNGIEKSKVHWTLAAAPTKLWAKRLFPALSEIEAESRLWDQIFHICRADKDNYLEEWKVHNGKLHARCAKLNKLKIKSLHFKGPGTDLTVGLSEIAIFKGGGDMSPRGVEFEPNIPTEECFTTPDYRMTNGTAKATRPFLVNGKLIKGLSMTFVNGVIVDFSAEEGQETFKEYISSDEGAKRLGEVALVGIDSPVYQSGIVFEEILYDENAACHIAVGVSYKFCLLNGDKLNEKELEEAGANQSSVHTDMMISSNEVDVSAISYAGEHIEIIKKGEWVEALR